MSLIYLRNITEETKELHLFVFEPNERKLVDSDWYIDPVIEAVSSGNFRVENTLETEFSLTRQLEILKGESEVAIRSQPPFASPDYYTKRNACADVVEIEAGQTATVSFQVLDVDMYSSGGVLYVKNNEFGDYLSGYVADLSGLIPEAHRVAFPQYPILDFYILKAYVNPMGIHECNTSPLVANIPQGMHICVDYHATSEGTTRKAVFNYFMFKKVTENE